MFVVGIDLFTQFIDKLIKTQIDFSLYREKKKYFTLMNSDHWVKIIVMFASLTMLLPLKGGTNKAEKTLKQLTSKVITL